ncbi:serine/threonine protein kinase, partial [Frankia sp. CcWB2]
CLPKGVLHRDVKMDNILFDVADTLKVTDFGIATIFAGTAATASAVVGTPKYMAPEQISGDRLGPATDIYALGIVLYELFTGAPPFQQLSLPALYLQHLNTPPDPPAGVPPMVAEVVMRALAKDPGQRHQDAHSFALDLAHAVTETLGPGWVGRSGFAVRLADDLREATERSPASAATHPASPAPPAPSAQEPAQPSTTGPAEMPQPAFAAPARSPRTQTAADHTATADHGSDALAEPDQLATVRPWAQGWDPSADGQPGATASTAWPRSGKQRKSKKPTENRGRPARSRSRRVRWVLVAVLLLAAIPAVALAIIATAGESDQPNHRRQSVSVTVSPRSQATTPTLPASLQARHREIYNMLDPYQIDLGTCEARTNLEGEPWNAWAAISCKTTAGYFRMQFLRYGVEMK